MEIFLKFRVTVDDEQGLAALVHVGQIACENPEKLLEENRSDGNEGKGNCQSNCPRHGTRQLRWLPCSIQLRMTMYLILLARQERWSYSLRPRERYRAQFQLPDKLKGPPKQPNTPNIKPCLLLFRLGFLFSYRIPKWFNSTIENQFDCFDHQLYRLWWKQSLGHWLDFSSGLIRNIDLPYQHFRLLSRNRLSRSKLKERQNCSLKWVLTFFVTHRSTKYYHAKRIFEKTAR